MLIKIGNWAKRFAQEFTGLLDSYPNAAAAYALRKLSATYSGSAVRVRRSSDDSELDIGFSGNELDQAALTDFVGANDGFVVTWYDQSGNNVNATKAASTNQPQIVSSGSVILNSENKPAIRFVKENNYSLTLTTGVSHKSIFWVGSTDTADSSSVPPALLGSNSNANSYIFICNNAAPFNSYAISLDGANADDVGSWYANGSFKATGGNVGTFGDIVSDQTYLHTIIYSAGDPIGEMVYLGRFIANGSFYYDGDISEFIIYSNDESSNRVGIENNINAYWDIY